MRAGRAFRYRAPGGAPVTQEATLARIRALAIPPAWTDVWICASENGHLQAVGVDAAGRRQYRYHPDWARRRHTIKHDRCLRLGRALPAARERVSAALRGTGLTHERVLAAAFRILDQGSMRVGSESYETFGLATLLRDHVEVRGDSVHFRYEGKGSILVEQVLRDRSLTRVIAELLDRDDPSRELLSWWDGRWRDVTSSDINAYLRSVLGARHTAKDFRTWNATVLMAQLLASGPMPEERRQREAIVRERVEAVAAHLGNTPTVARASYIDPRVIDLYLDGTVIPAEALPSRRRDDPVHPSVERAVVDLLS